jgi:hypothetical protein
MTDAATSPPSLVRDWINKSYFIELTGFTPGQVRGCIY